MANIPVEREGGTPWWTWLLALLAIVGLIWLIAELFDAEPDEDDLAVADDIGMVEGTDLDEDDDVMEADAMTETGAITSFAALTEGTANIGREVDLENMEVTALTGDSSFAIAPTPGQENQGALIVLEDMGEWRVGPGDGSDGEYDVNESNSMDIEGTVRAFDETTPDYADMSDADRNRALRQGVYISANSVNLEKNMNGDGTEDDM